MSASSSASLASDSPLKVLRSPTTPSEMSVTLMSVASYALAMSGELGTDREDTVTSMT
jgi:hypothetical protein